MKYTGFFGSIAAIAGCIIMLSACVTTRQQIEYLPRITEITRTQKNLIHNFVNMYHPSVLKEQLSGNEGYPYTMWFFGWAVADGNPGWAGCDATFVARGKDLYTWEVYCGDDTWDTGMSPELWVPILTAGNVWYDSWHIGDPSVVKKDGIFYMMLSSAAFGLDMIPPDAFGDEDGDVCLIMGAVSNDGINWTKCDGPILVWEPELTMFSTQNGNQIPKNFYGWYHRPSLMFDESMNKWRMWFDYFHPGMGITLGYAEADHGADIMQMSSWTIINAATNPQYPQELPNPDVIKIDNRYYLATDPRVVTYGANPRLVPSEGWYRRQILLFVSDDGYKWREVGWIEPDSDTQANQVPCLYYENDVLYIFYATMGWDDWRQNTIRVIEIKREVFEKW